MHIEKTAAAAVAGILGSDAVLHLFWAATGSSWPASSTTALSRGLLKADVSFKPVNLVIIASMPIAASVLVLARAGMLGRIGRRLPRWIPKLGTLALTAGVSLRLLAGIVWATGNRHGFRRRLLPAQPCRLYAAVRFSRGRVNDGAALRQSLSSTAVAFAADFSMSSGPSTRFPPVTVLPLTVSVYGPWATVSALMSPSVKT